MRGKSSIFKVRKKNHIGPTAETHSPKLSNQHHSHDKKSAFSFHPHPPSFLLSTFSFFLRFFSWKGRPTDLSSSPFPSPLQFHWERRLTRGFSPIISDWLLSGIPHRVCLVISVILEPRVRCRLFYLSFFFLNFCVEMDRFHPSDHEIAWIGWIHDWLIDLFLPGIVIVAVSVLC